MKKVQTPYQQFNKENQKRVDILFDEYRIKIDLAKDGFKSKAHFRFKDKMLDQHRGTQNALGNNSSFFVELNEELEDDKSKIFEFEFNKKFQSLKEQNKDNLLQKLSNLFALDKLISWLIKEDAKYIKYQSQFESKSFDLKWKSKTELEFVQLVYALNEAKYLSNEKDEITTLVKEVAIAFNYKLGEHWQSNLSDNINNRNADYEPEIFDKLGIAFKDYREKRIEENKKKKPK